MNVVVSDMFLFLEEYLECRCSVPGNLTGFFYRFHSPATLCKKFVSHCRDHSLNKYASIPCNEIC